MVRRGDDLRRGRIVRQAPEGPIFHAASGSCGRHPLRAAIGRRTAASARHRLRGRNRQPQREARADANLALSDQIAAHQARELPADRQAKAGASLLVGDLGLLKGLENRFEVLSPQHRMMPLTSSRNTA